MWVPKRTKQEWKEEKRPIKLLQIHGRKPWLIQRIKDYTISRNRTIPIIKEHQVEEKGGETQHLRSAQYQENKQETPAQVKDLRKKYCVKRNFNL